MAHIQPAVPLAGPCSNITLTIIFSNRSSWENGKATLELILNHAVVAKKMQRISQDHRVRARVALLAMDRHCQHLQMSIFFQAWRESLVKRKKKEKHELEGEVV